MWSHIFFRRFLNIKKVFHPNEMVYIMNINRTSRQILWLLKWDNRQKKWLQKRRCTEWTWIRGCWHFWVQMTFTFFGHWPALFKDYVTLRGVIHSLHSFLPVKALTRMSCTHSTITLGTNLDFTKTNEYIWWNDRTLGVVFNTLSKA